MKEINAIRNQIKQLKKKLKVIKKGSDKFYLAKNEIGSKNVENTSGPNQKTADILMPPNETTQTKEYCVTKSLDKKKKTGTKHERKNAHDGLTSDSQLRKELSNNSERVNFEDGVKEDSICTLIQPSASGKKQVEKDTAADKVSINTAIVQNECTTVNPIRVSKVLPPKDASNTQEKDAINKNSTEIIRSSTKKKEKEKPNTQKTNTGGKTSSNASAEVICTDNEKSVKRSKSDDKKNALDESSTNQVMKGAVITAKNPNQSEKSVRKNASNIPLENLKHDAKKYIKSNMNEMNKSVNTFKRVKVSDLDAKKIISNAYVHKNSVRKNDYGMKAYNDFIKTKGKDFRAEKNKKKKGRYSGGKINMDVCSVKLDVSDDEF